MAKKPTVNFVCQECGYDSPQWLGKCPECGNWNTMKEFRISNATAKTGSGMSTNLAQSKPQKLQDIVYKERSRIQTEYSELNNVLGGGIVRGSATLIAGDPGVGKSTLLLQLAISLSSTSKVLYISGEESVDQVKMRAVRIAQETKGKKKVSVDNDNLFLLSLTDADAIVEQIAEMKPDLVVIDSIQTIESQNVSGLSGSVGQVRYAALQFIRLAKQYNIPIVIVGHVTKEGMVAGPMVLSHMVDTVLFLEGEKFAKTRILRSLKNRFGPVDEVGIFLMEEHGMQEATNPEELFLTQGREQVPGSVLVSTLEGSRAFLVELQALAVTTRLPMPRRVVSGVDSRRVELLLAVLQKHCHLPLDTMDVFVNVAGGMKLADPGIDLGICLAVYSSFKNIALSQAVGIAEVGLLGELRVVNGLEKRIKEAEKLGFKNIIAPKKYKSLREVLTMIENK
ncbi:MAG TPA: DNA repair protein RadA [Candidatus Saccharimonadales bacterium]|nr:DNA repair protein RadA [Candidatus Saccharimonadales bacterium]